MNWPNTKNLLRQTSEFTKLHYSRLLPFSFLFFVLNLLAIFIKSNFSILFIIGICPLIFSIPYFAFKSERDANPSFKDFFEVYTYSKRYFIILLVKILAFIFVLFPMIYALSDVMAPFNFDRNLFILAIREGVYIPARSLSLISFFCITLAMLCYPFIIYAEYFSIFQGLKVKESFIQSYKLGQKYYLSLSMLMFVQMVVFSIGTILSCGFIFVFAFPFFCLMSYYIYCQYIQEQTL